MNEFSISIKVEGLAELAAAINRLAGQGSAATVQGAAPASQASGMYAPPVAAGTGQPPAGIPQPPLQAPPQMPPAMPRGQVPPQAPPAMPQGQVPPQAPPVAPQGQAPSPVPSAPPVQGYALEQLQVAAAGLMSSGRGQQVMGILQRFGIQAMTELPKERYGEFAMALREAGAQV